MTQHNISILAQSARELHVSAEELEQIESIDVVGQTAAELKQRLLPIIEDEDKARQLADHYQLALAHYEDLTKDSFIDELIENKDKSGPLIDFIDWDFIKEELHKGALVFKAKKGDTILDLSKRLQGEATDEDVHFFIIMDGTIRYERKDMDGNVIKSADNIPYEYFGEQSILNDKINDSSNVVASDTAVLLRINRDTFLQALERKKTEMLEKLTKEIGMPELVAKELLEKGRINTYRKYQSMSTQGQDENKFRIILQGSAFVLRDSRHLTSLHENNFVGDIETLKGDRKNVASVLTDEDTIVLEIDIEQWEKILDKNKLYKLKLAQAAYKKEKAGEINYESDPYSIFDYSFTKLDEANNALPAEQRKSQEDLERVKVSILQTAQETISMINETEHEGRDIQAVEDLFQFICESLEAQETDDLKYYVSHGAKHSINTVNFTNAIMQGSKTLRGSSEDRYGENTAAIARLVALFHDIGYPELKTKQEEAYQRGGTEKIYKWEHAALSVELLHKHFPYEKFQKILNISREDYELFIMSILYHGADNPDEEQIAEGRDFMKVSNVENPDPEIVEDPLAVIMRIADNLDLIGERLSKLQKDDIFLVIFKEIYYECKAITDKEKGKLDGTDDPEGIKKIKAEYSELRKQKMREIMKDATPDEIEPKDQIRWKEITDNFDRIIEMDNYEGYLHFKSVAIAQNVFVREEGNRIIIYIEYNEPATKLPKVLINWQSGRLKDCIKNSITLTNAQGDPIKVKVKQIFPTS
ncbi:cyclic nucleotide-binding domain-containing protein [Patescibacteria group bacterium]